MYEKVYNVDLKLCGFFNRACHYNFIKLLFSVISRLGNGVFWYLLMLSLPFIYGFTAITIVFQMLMTGILGLIIYKIMKQNTERLRPYMVCDAIKLGTQPLDQYSFPSGHTLHAVGFSNILCFYYPELTLMLYSITALLAASRMILGLHFPSDVLMGAGIGLSTSSFIIAVFN